MPFNSGYSSKKLNVKQIGAWKPASHDYHSYALFIDDSMAVSRHYYSFLKNAIRHYRLDLADITYDAKADISSDRLTIDMMTSQVILKYME
jgi:hypothetical protein